MIRIGIYAQIPTDLPLDEVGEHLDLFNKEFEVFRGWALCKLEPLKPDVRGFVVYSDTRVGRERWDDYGQPVVREYHAANPDLDWYPDKAITWAWGRSPYPSGAYAQRGGGYGFVFVQNIDMSRNLGDRTWAHELGHQLNKGLGHGGTDVNGKFDPTGDSTTIMSYEYGMEDMLDTEAFTPLEMMLIGFPMRIAEGSCVLVPAETPLDCLEDDEFQMLKVRV